jgi:diguanylate cyclase (GGDEF)-like protein/PAS domain S-box-containing protein
MMDRLLKHRTSMYGAKLLSVALAYFACGRIGLALSSVDYHIALIWLPAGIAVAALLRWGYGCWPGIFVGALATGYSINASLLLDSCVALGNTAGPLFSARILQRLNFQEKLDRPRDIMLLVAAAALGMLASAGGGLISLLLFGALPAQGGGLAWLSWWAGDVVGVLIAVPLLLNMSGSSVKDIAPRRLEFLAWTLLTLALGWGVFFLNNDAVNRPLPLVFTLLPMVVWSAMRFGIAGSSLALLLPAGIATTATVMGSGPFHTPAAERGLLVLWLYLATLVLVNLMVAALQARRKQVEQAVDLDRDLNEGLIQALPGIFYVFDASGRLLKWNRQLERVLQYSGAEIARSHPLDFFAASDRQLIEESIHKVFMFGETAVEAGLLAKDGTSIPYYFTGRSVQHDGKVVLVGMGIDVSERKQAEQQLVASEMQLRAIFEAEPECVKLMAEDGTVLQMNPAGLRMLEADAPEQIIGKKALGIVAPSDRKMFVALMRRVFAGESASLEFEVIGLKGNRRWLETYEVPMRDAQGRITSMLGITRDITERKQIEQKSEVLMRRHQALMNSALEGIHVMDMDGNIVEANDTFCRMLGYTQQEAAGLNVADWDAQWSLEELTERFRKLIHLDGALFETRHRRKDGSVIEVEVSTTGAEIGGQYYLYASSRDISERRRAEEDLRIAAATFDTQEAIMITAPDARILRVNQAFQEITGYSAAEVIGQDPSLFRSGRHDAVYYRKMWSTLLDTGKWSGEIWDRRKDGSVYPKLMTITAVYGQHRQVTHYVAIFRDISDLKHSEQEIHQLAFYDALTGLPNRRLLLDRLQQAMALGTRTGAYGALLFLDLDHFKTINDTRGHAAGDELLVAVSRRLQSCVREGDSVARMGGDEFVVVLENLSGIEDEAAALTEAVAEKILKELDRPYVLTEFVCISTASIGISLFRGHHESAAGLLQHTDVAMYQAKAEGRNAIRFFDPHMQTVLEARATLEADLRNALDHQLFSLHYQVQVDRLRRPIGAEALLRWEHPRRGLVLPGEFTPLAEENGLIVPIGLWVLQTACTQLRAWQDDPLTRDLTLAVNVSAKQFRQPDFVMQLQRVLQESGASPARLKLELTESTVLENVADAISKMREIKSLGISFSMDDFGTGYSSLQYLKRLPLDQIKIDQSFVRDIVTDPNDAAIVQTIIAMTEILGFDVIAEGVETEAQREFLDLRNCPAFQGYLFGKPVPLAQFETALRDRSDSSRHSSALP